MCLTCGCNRLYDDHGDQRNITMRTLEAATRTGAFYGTVDQALQNLNNTIQGKPDPDVTLASAILRPSLLFDIDGVLGFLTETIVAALNAHFGLNLVVSDMRNYWIEDDLEPDQSKWLIEQFQRGVFYENVAPDYSAIAAVQALHHDGYEVIVSSDRPPETTRDATIRWLKKWRIPYDQLVLQGRGGKVAIAAAHGPSDPLWAFDDDPRKAMTIPRPGVELWIPLRPWTPKGIGDRPGVHPFDAWTDVLKAAGVNTMVQIPQFSRSAGPASEPNA